MKGIRVDRNESINAIELNDLYRTNNWQIDPIEKLEKSLQTLWGWLTARNQENRLIGFVQVLSDGIRHAYILKMIVHSDFRKQGIGSIIMTELMTMLRENNLYPTLVATPENDKFYEKFGFEAESNGFKAMCIRKAY
ncbi:MAG: ribosomal-protein-alanine acetyltransferase [Bacilli bacterium]|nr:ribosomal-protein-alanine acetyltransferase [Bacilli bacterium]